MKNLTSFRNTLFFFFSFSLSLSLSLSARPPATKRTKAMPPLSTSERNLSFLSGAHVLITGGASGIGAALADACAAGGAGAVSILDADARGAAAAAALLREGNPGLFAAAFACDVTSPEQVETISLESGEREGRGGEENGGGRERGRMTVRGDRGRARLFFLSFRSPPPPPKKKTLGKKKRFAPPSGPRPRPTDLSPSCSRTPGSAPAGCSWRGARAPQALLLRRRRQRRAARRKRRRRRSRALLRRRRAPPPLRLRAPGRGPWQSTTGASSASSRPLYRGWSPREEGASS